ncbi:MAG TPA: aldo/keto reductase, partial [Streptosporangiaceae bacterium]
GFSQAYGHADDSDSIATIRRAVDLGGGLLDTAMSYGAGHNEELVGRAIEGRRDEVVLATKFGIIRGKDRSVRIDGRPENVRGYCDASLRRLGVDHIDLYYQHRIDPEVPVEETVGAMAALVSEGKVRCLGMSEATPDELARATAVHPISAMQCEWSLWWREVEDDVVPAARRLGIGVVAYSPLGRRRGSRSRRLPPPRSALRRRRADAERSCARRGRRPGSRARRQPGPADARLAAGPGRGRRGHPGYQARASGQRERCRRGGSALGGRAAQDRGDRAAVGVGWRPAVLCSAADGPIRAVTGSPQACLAHAMAALLD